MFNDPDNIDLTSKVVPEMVAVKTAVATAEVSEAGEAMVLGKDN